MLSGKVDGPDVTVRDVSWEMTEKRVRHGMVFPIGPVSEEFLFPGRLRKIRFVQGRRQTSSHDDYVPGIDVPWKDNIRCGIFRHVSLHQPHRGHGTESALLPGPGHVILLPQLR